jgi:hypothetical protein
MPVPAINYLEYYIPGLEGAGFNILVVSNAGNFTFTNWSTWDTILTMKANEMHYFPDLFDKVLYMFCTCPLSIIRSISTLYTRNRYLSC